jgi:hypothetical protein
VKQIRFAILKLLKNAPSATPENPFVYRKDVS